MGSFRAGGAYAPANPALVAVIEAAAARSPYDVIMFSGDRDGTGASQHDSGSAVDVVLIDPSTGQRIPNLGAGGEAFRIYEEFAHLARDVQQEIAPQLNDTFRWGGYFGPSSLNQSGADLMHFDMGSSSNMRMGSWDGGLNAEGQRFVANLGSGMTYSDQGRVAADGSTTYANLWGRAPLTAPGPNAPATNGAGANGPLGYAGSPAPLTGAAAAVTAMGAGGTGDGGLPTIRNGAGNRSQPDANVRALQEFLNANGQNLRVDGIFGDMTERAVRAYQQANGLTVDGIVGPETWGHIAGTAATAGGGEVSAIPGPVRAFVQRVFGDGAATNLSSRIEAFRNGIRKGMSPTDAFTQARGQPLAGTPAAGSPTALLPPKSAPVPPANPSRAPAPVIPQAAAPAPQPAAPATPAQPTQPAVAGDGLIMRPVPKPVVGDGLVNRPAPGATAPSRGPADTTYDDIYGAPALTDAQIAQYDAERASGSRLAMNTSPLTRPVPIVGDGLVDRAAPPPPAQPGRVDPFFMPRGRPESSVPTNPAAPIGEGEYLPLEWRQIQQFERNATQFPSYQGPGGAVPALIPGASPRADAFSLGSLRRTEGPTQSGAPVYDPRSVSPSLRIPTGDLPPIQPAPPWGTEPPPPAYIERAPWSPDFSVVNPQAVVASMPKVSIPVEGWGPPSPASMARGVDADAIVAGMPQVEMPNGWTGPVSLAKPPPVDLRVAPAKPAAIAPPPPVPLVPQTKAAPPPPPKVVVVAAPPPPKPVIPKKAA